MSPVDLTPAQAARLGITPAKRARKTKAGEGLAAPYPYRCSCGTVHPTYLKAERCADTHGGGRLEAVYP